MTNQNEQSQISVGIRLATMLMDHLFMTVIAMLFWIPGFISMFSHLFFSNLSHAQPPPPDFMNGVWSYIGLFGFALYFCKDIFNGRSIAKRILSLQVVDNSTGKVASPFRCFVRNITCILWPVEAIVALVNTGRRLGDRLAGTKLVRFDPSLEQPGIKIVGVAIPICISYGMMLVLVLGIPTFRWHKAYYSETSYNPSESRQLEKLLADSLGQYLTPDIKIYDSTKVEKLKYILTILQLKENHIKDGYNFQKLNNETQKLIYSQFPHDTFFGELIYFYKTSGQGESKQMRIGIDLKPN
jgi:uncharacterized RDD family membrane protein YckC